MLIRRTEPFSFLFCAVENKKLKTINMITAEEYFRNKLKELYPDKKEITLSLINITAEQGMLWAFEYAKLYNK